MNTVNLAVNFALNTTKLANSVINESKVEAMIRLFSKPVNKENVKILCEEMDNYSLNKEERLMFLANVFHECNFLNTLIENLYYTTPERLKVVFKSKFKDKSLDYCKSFTRNQIALGNLVYDNRFGNGINEGYKYRGRGLLMITFKDNYRRFSTLKYNLVENPDLLCDFRTATKVSLEYFVKRADKTTLQSCRKGIAGSLFGFNEVKSIYEKIKKI